MKIITNNYMKTVNALTKEALPQVQENSSAEVEDEIETNPTSNTDTFIMSVGGKEFIAQKKESDSAMFTAEIVSDFDEFRSAIKSMAIWKLTGMLWLIRTEHLQVRHGWRQFIICIKTQMLQKI